MGIKNFSRVFEGTNITFKQACGMGIAIDAMTEIWRASLGARSIDLLTDPEGNPTIHINIIISLVAKLKKLKCRQIWVFDYFSEAEEPYHNPAKLDEVNRRIQTKITAQRMEATAEDKDKAAKRSFILPRQSLLDAIKILDYWGIEWISAPRGFEGEAVCAWLALNDYVDIVYSGDTDTIAFGAPVLWRYNTRTKKIQEYKQEAILEQIKANNPDHTPDITDIRKIAMIMGNDFCEKTPKIGPITVLKKYLSVELTDKQKEMIKVYDISELNNLQDRLTLNNTTAESNLDDLVDWLVADKGFNRARITKLIAQQ